MSKNQAEVKMKASERLSALEATSIALNGNLNKASKRVGELELIVFNISRENELLRDALQLLNEKQLSIISLVNDKKPLTDENINDKITVLKESALKDKLLAEVNAGNIKETDVVGDNSVLVCRELTTEGVVENPRLQFLVGRLIDELKNKFVGKKVGDLIKGEDGKLDIEIYEIYDFVEKELVEESAEASSDSSE